MHVCRAAAEFGGEPIQIRIHAVGGPMTRPAGAGDLVGLLVVLMGPHVITEGAGQCIESNSLQTISKARITQVSCDKFIGKHGLNYSAQLTSLRMVRSCNVYICAEHAIGNSVV